MTSSESSHHYGITKRMSVKCDFTWRIEAYTSQLDSCNTIIGPVFESSPPGQKWCLEIDNAVQEDWYGYKYTEHVYVYLTRSSKTNRQIAEVDISVVGRFGMSWSYSTRKKVVFGYDDERPEVYSFRKVSPIIDFLLFPNDTLTLQCNITTNEERSMTYKSKEDYTKISMENI